MTASEIAAVGLHRYGGPDVLALVSRPAPTAGPDEVVVRVQAATVNPTDVLLRSGGQAAALDGVAPPYVPGMEFAGTVHEAGPGVDLPVGTPVMGVVNPRRPEGGAQAELVVVPVASVAPLRPRTDPVAAATVPMNGLTALMALDELAPGPAVLVTGGAGALGGYTLQMGRAAGLHLVADAHDADADLLRTLGASEIVPRGPGMTTAVLARFPDGVDGLLDAAMLDADTLVRDGGTVVEVRGRAGAADSADDTRVRRCTVSVLRRVTDTAALRRLAGYLADGVLTPRIAAVLPAAEAAEAHRMLDRGGLRGRVVLRFS